MALVHTRKISTRKRLANRRNALKSTGPRGAEGKRRSRMNALKHGLCESSFREAMVSLGENPEEFERLHRDLIFSLEPSNPLEAKLVEDLAKLWWKKGRAERAQSGVQVQEVERLQVERLRKLLEVNRQAMDEAECLEVGLRRVKDCAGKFEEALNFLDLMIAWAERRESDVDFKTALRALYGTKPTWRGTLILGLFQQVEEGEDDEPEDEAAEDEPEDEAPEATAPAEGPTDAAPPENGDAGASEDFSWRAALLHLLLEERRDVLNEQEQFLREHVEISPATRYARLAPTDARWTWILRRITTWTGR